MQLSVAESNLPPVVRPAPWQAYAAMITGILLISTSGIFVKWAAVPGPVAGVYRTAIAVVVTALPFALRARRVAWSQRAVLIALLGGCLFACDIALWNTALLHTSVANAVLFGNTAPIWVGLGAILLFRERLRSNFWLGLGLAFAGVSLIAGSDLLLAPGLDLGNGLALVAAVFYAGYMLVSQRGRVRLDALSYFWLVALGGLVSLLLMTQVLHESLSVPTASLAPLLALGLITHTCGWLVLSYAQGHLPASVVSPSLLGQPIMASLLAIPLLGEGLSLVQVVGGMVVIAGIYLIHRTHR